MYESFRELPYVGQAWPDKYCWLGVGAMGQERSLCDRGKVKGRQKVRVDVSKRKSITGMMTGRKESGKKGTTEKAAGERSTTM